MPGIFFQRVCLSSASSPCTGKTDEVAMRRREPHGSQKKSDLDLKVKFSRLCGAVKALIYKNTMYSLAVAGQIDNHGIKQKHWGFNQFYLTWKGPKN